MPGFEGSMDCARAGKQRLAAASEMETHASAAISTNLYRSSLLQNLRESLADPCDTEAPCGVGMRLRISALTENWTPSFLKGKQLS